MQDRNLSEALALKVEAQGCIETKKVLLSDLVQRHQILDLDIVSPFLLVCFHARVLNWLGIYSAAHHRLLAKWSCKKLCTYYCQSHQQWTSRAFVTVLQIVP